MSAVLVGLCVSFKSFVHSVPSFVGPFFHHTSVGGGGGGGGAVRLLLVVVAVVVAVAVCCCFRCCYCFWQSVHSDLVSCGFKTGSSILKSSTQKQKRDEKKSEANKFQREVLFWGCAVAAADR